MLVFLDALLDTRLSTMKTIRESLPSRLIATGKYMDRITDDFTSIMPTFPIEEYREAWRTRTKDVIRTEVYSTYMTAFVSKLIDDITLDALTNPINSHVTMTINIAPYDLDESGREAIRGMAMQHFGLEAEIINVPIDYCSPGMLNESYDDVFMYEFDKWFTIHFEDLRSNPNPSLHMYAPLLTVKPTDKKYDIMKDKNFMETNLAMFMTLTYLSAGSFSMLPPAVKENNKES